MVPTSFPNNGFNGTQGFVPLPLVGFTFNTQGVGGFQSPVSIPYSVSTVTPAIVNLLHSLSDANGVDFYPVSASTAVYSQVDLVFGVPQGLDPSQFHSIGIASRIAAGTITETGLCGPGSPDTATGNTINSGTGFTAAILKNDGNYSAPFASTVDKSVYNNSVNFPISVPTIVFASTAAYSGNVIVLSYLTNSPGAIGSTCSSLSVFYAQVALNP